MFYVKITLVRYFNNNYHEARNQIYWKSNVPLERICLENVNASYHTLPQIWKIRFLNLLVCKSGSIIYSSLLEIIHLIYKNLNIQVFKFDTDTQNWKKKYIIGKMKIFEVKE